MFYVFTSAGAKESVSPGERLLFPVCLPFPRAGSIEGKCWIRINSITPTVVIPIFLSSRGDVNRCLRTGQRVFERRRGTIGSRRKSLSIAGLLFYIAMRGIWYLMEERRLWTIAGVSLMLIKYVKRNWERSTLQIFREFSCAGETYSFAFERRQFVSRPRNVQAAQLQVVLNRQSFDEGQNGRG